MKKNLGTMLIALIVSAVCVSDLDAQRQDNQNRQDRNSRMGEMLKRMPVIAALDANGDGEISAEEIEKSVAALKALDTNGDGIVKSSEMLPDRSRGRSSQGRARQTRSDNAPKVGDLAPTFKLKSLDGESETDLADFKGKKPVVLFFGSYT